MAKRKSVKKTRDNVNKQQRLIVRLAINAIVVAAIVGVLYAVNSFVQDFSKKALDEKRSTENQLRKIETKTRDLTQQYKSQGEASDIYANLATERENMDFRIEPLKLRSVLLALKKQFYITTLNLEVEAQETLDKIEVSSPTLKAVRFDLRINLGAISDHYVYRFINEIHDQFPGIVSTNEISLERVRPLNIDVLTQISRGNLVENVRGTVKLSWYGFVEIVTDKPISAGGA